jgi:adenine-specific DNA-methyltransferase
MLDLAAAAMHSEPVRIVDPGAGVGAFTLAAAKRWPRADVFAIDVNVVTLGLLAARIAFEIDVESEDADALSRIHLELDDYLHDLGDRFGQARGPVLVLGNPPYTRIQELPTEYRSRAIKLCGEISKSGHANLAVLFQAATLNHMRPEDASCMVLPGSVSFTRASLGVRHALWHSNRPVTVQRTPATTRPFSGRSVQAAILLVGPLNAQREPIQFARIRFGGDEPKVLEKWEGNRDGVEPRNWFLRKGSKASSAGFALSEIATVQRGVATGASSMFFLSDAEAEHLPHDVIVPAAPTLRRFSAAEMDAAAHATWGDTHTKRWLLAIPRDYLLDGPLRAYVQQFEAEARKRFLVAQRNPWYSITSLPRPDIFIAPLSKKDFKIVINTVRAVPSNNLFGITMLNGTAPEALADWLRSNPGQRALLHMSRRYHGGSHKLEPGDLKRVRIPAKLTKSCT